MDRPGWRFMNPCIHNSPAIDVHPIDLLHDNFCCWHEHTCTLALGHILIFLIIRNSFVQFSVHSLVNYFFQHQKKSVTCEILVYNQTFCLFNLTNFALFTNCDFSLERSHKCLNSILQSIWINCSSLTPSLLRGMIIWKKNNSIVYLGTYFMLQNVVCSEVQESAYLY